MNVQEAIESPRWATRSFPASPFPHTMYPGDMSVEARVPQPVRDALIARGHKLKVGGPWTMGSLAAIIVDPKTGVLNAGTDPRVDAYASARYSSRQSTGDYRSLANRLKKLWLF